MSGDPCICGDTKTWHQECYRRVLAAQAPQAAEPVAWMTEDGRVITAKTKQNIKNSSEASFSIPLYLAPQAPAAQPLTIPAEIATIIENLHTQDNRITDNPLFSVQQKRIVAGLDIDYANAFSWICDGLEVDSEEAARLDGMREIGDPIPDDCRRVGYIETWEFVTGCLTEQGCKDYIAVNGHNLKEPRIYAYGSYRNREFIALRKWLMSMAAQAPAAQPLTEDAFVIESLIAAGHVRALTVGNARRIFRGIVPSAQGEQP